MSSVSHLSEICGYLHGVNSRKTMYVYTYVLLNITNLQSVYKQRPSKVFPVFLNGKSLKEIVVFPVGLTGPFINRTLLLTGATWRTKSLLFSILFWVFLCFVYLQRSDTDMVFAFIPIFLGFRFLMSRFYWCFGYVQT